MRYEIHADGICEPNPGKGAWAFLVLDENGEMIAAQSAYVGDGETNNTMEYQAIIEAFRWARTVPDATCIVRSDSQLAVNQITGVWAVKSPGLQKYHDEATKLQGRTLLGWIPGNENQADAGTRLAYKNGTGEYPEPRANPRHVPPTDKQIALLRRLGADIPASKHEATKLIGRLLENSRPY